MNQLSRAVLLTGVAAITLAGGALAHGAASLAEAKTLSAEKGLPILIDFGTSW